MYQKFYEEDSNFKKWNQTLNLKVILLFPTLALPKTFLKLNKVIDNLLRINKKSLGKSLFLNKLALTESRSKIRKTKSFFLWQRKNSKKFSI